MQTHRTGLGSDESHLTYEVETSRCQPLGEMRGEQKAGEESQDDVINVESVHSVCGATFSDAQEDLDQTQIRVTIKCGFGSFTLNENQTRVASRRRLETRATSCTPALLLRVT